MLFTPVPDFPQVPVLPVDAMTGETAAVLTTDFEDETTLALLAEHLGPKLLLQECWSRCFPRCGVLISSSISGGTLQERFRDAAQAYPNRCWLLLEPLRMAFPLPCPTGTGLPLHTLPKKKGFYSPSLCCQYTHFLQDNHGVMVLWDTEETLRQKIDLAKDAGFLGFAAAGLPIDK